MPMRNEDKAILKKQAFHLVKHIIVDDLLLAALYSKSVISESHKEKIESKPTNSAKVNELLTILPKRPAKAFQGFCEALNDAEQNDIVDSYLTIKVQPEDDDCDEDLEEREMKFKEALANSRVNLMDKLNMETRFFGRLIELKVIPRQMQSKITLNADSDVQVERLLDYLAKRPITDLDNFLEALKDSEQAHVAEFLEEKIK